MALQRGIHLRHGEVFPHGAYILDPFEPVGDFDAPPRPGGSRAQATPFTIVEVSGVTLTAWIDDSNKERPHIQWSIRANGVHALGQTRAARSDEKALS